MGKTCDDGASSDGTANMFDLSFAGVLRENINLISKSTVNGQSHFGGVPTRVLGIRTLTRVVNGMVVFPRAAVPTKALKRARGIGGDPPWLHGKPVDLGNKSKRTIIDAELDKRQAGDQTPHRRPSPILA